MKVFVLVVALYLFFQNGSNPTANFQIKKIISRITKPLAVSALMTTLCFPMNSIASDTREVGNMATSGFFFKDTLKISGFEDPKIDGITLYLADFERPINEKLAKDFFDDPSSSSLTCAQTGPIDREKIYKSVSLDPSGDEVFEESRNLFFKVSYIYILNKNLISSIII